MKKSTSFCLYLLMCGILLCIPGMLFINNALEVQGMSGFLLLFSIELWLLIIGLIIIIISIIIWFIQLIRSNKLYKKYMKNPIHKTIITLIYSGLLLILPIYQFYSLGSISIIGYIGLIGGLTVIGKHYINLLKT